MTQQAKFEVYNDNGKIVINESYKNLFLSRKIAGSTLPLEYMSWNTGCYIKGGFWARRIDFNQTEKDEIFAAVAVPAGQEHKFFVFNNIMGNVNKAYLCAAQRVYPGRVSDGYYWDYTDTVETGMSDTRNVPDGVDVFVFAKSNKGLTTSDTAGLQIRDANNRCVYDSRYRSARIVGGGTFPFTNISATRRIAIGGGSGSWSGLPVDGDPTHYKTIIFGCGTVIRPYSDVNPTLVYRPATCMSLTNDSTDFCRFDFEIESSSIIVFDVTNF